VKSAVDRHPALQDQNGDLTFDTAQMAHILMDCFFVQDLGDINKVQYNYPSPTPPWPFKSSSGKELIKLLRNVSLKVAPGQTGIS